MNRRHAITTLLGATVAPPQRKLNWQPLGFNLDKPIDELTTIEFYEVIAKMRDSYRADSCCFRNSSK